MSNVYRTYIISTTPKTVELGTINQLGGRIYSKTVSVIRKVHDRKDFWLSVGDTKKYMRCLAYSCHAHSVQAIVDDYYGALKSYFQRMRKDPNAKPPYKTSKYHTFTWRASGITVAGGKLRLSMGKNRTPVYIKVARKFRKVPVEVSMVYNRVSRRYDFHAIYQTQPTQHNPKQRKIVAVDQGEIHPIVAFDGKSAAIYNGRAVRAIKQYRNKFLAQINQKLSRCRGYSQRWKFLKSTKNRVLNKLANQIRDAEHKITSRFVSACKIARVQTIVLGDLTHIRQSIEYSKKSNQKLHQWSFGKIASMITYKAKVVGIMVDTESERYTSQTCPSCQNRKKPSGRTYSCPKCHWEGHRDVVGASNIWTKYQGFLFNPVVGGVASPAGVRFNAHLRRLDSWSPFRGLMSKKSVRNR